MDTIKVLKFSLVFVFGFASGALFFNNSAFFSDKKNTEFRTKRLNSNDSDTVQQINDSGTPAHISKIANEGKNSNLQQIIQDQEAVMTKLQTENARLQKDLNELKENNTENIIQKNSLQDTEEERMALTAEYFHTSKLNEAFSTAIEQAMKGSLNSPQEAEQFKEIIDRHLNWEQLEPTFLKIYAEVFTAPELYELVQFNHTSLGRKLIEKGSELSQKSVTEMQKFMQKMLPEFKQDLENARTASNTAKSKKAENSKM